MSSCGADAHKTYLFTGIRGLDWLPRVYSSRQGARRPRDSVGRCDTRGDLAPWEPSFALFALLSHCRAADQREVECLSCPAPSGRARQGGPTPSELSRVRVEQAARRRHPARSPVVSNEQERAKNLSEAGSKASKTGAKSFLCP